MTPVLDFLDISLHLFDMKNYYAVRVGYNTGIYDYMDEAKDQIR